MFKSHMANRRYGSNSFFTVKTVTNYSSKKKYNCNIFQYLLQYVTSLLALEGDEMAFMSRSKIFVTVMLDRW